jgi:hypothetical protein
MGWPMTTVKIDAQGFATQFHSVSEMRRAFEYGFEFFDSALREERFCRCGRSLVIPGRSSVVRRAPGMRLADDPGIAMIRIETLVPAPRQRGGGVIEGDVRDGDPKV